MITKPPPPKSIHKNCQDASDCAEAKEVLRLETLCAAPLQGQKSLQKRGLPYAFGPLGPNAFFSPFVVVAVPLGPSRRASLEGPCSGAANFEPAFATFLQGQKNLQKRGLPCAFGLFAAFVQGQKNPAKTRAAMFLDFWK